MLKERVKETRSILDSRLEVRRSEDQPVKIRGYAALFNVLSEDFGGWRERILPGAFGNTLQEPTDIKALWNHDSKYVLGRTPKTLRVGEDETGLWFEVEPSQAQWVQDLLVTIERGDINEMSFGFHVVKDRVVRVGDEENSPVIRELVEVNLLEVSPVTFPAYKATSVHVRSLDNVFDLRREQQRLDNLSRWANRKQQA